MIINYRKAISEAIARSMRTDDRVIFLGEDVGRAGGAFKSTDGLYEEFGPERVWDTPIAEQAILGAAMGAAITGLRPIAEIMFSDFFGVCWDVLANQIAKSRYMTGGQVGVPLVVRAHNGSGGGFGAQHSQSLESAIMAVPGLRVVCPSTPEDLVGLFQSAVADDDPVVFLEHKGLFAIKGEVPESPFAIPLGEAKVLRSGADVTVVSIAATVHTALAAAETMSTRDVDVEVLDLRCLAPLDMVAVARSVEKTARVVLVEEGPGVCGWTDHVAARLSDEHLDLLDGPVRRVTGALAPLPFSKVLEHAALPGEADVVRAIESLL